MERRQRRVGHRSELTDLSHSRSAAIVICRKGGAAVPYKQCHFRILHGLAPYLVLMYALTVCCSRRSSREENPVAARDWKRGLRRGIGGAGTGAISHTDTEDTKTCKACSPFRKYGSRQRRGLDCSSKRATLSLGRLREGKWRPGVRSELIDDFRLRSAVIMLCREANELSVSVGPL